YLAPPISRRGEEGFPSRSMHPCHRATAITPPERSAEARGGRAVLPSPLSDRLGLRALLFRGYLCVHLRCGPVTCTIPRDCFSDRLQLIRFPSWLPSSYKASSSSPGGTVSHWTHQPSLVAPPRSAARAALCLAMRGPRQLHLIVIRPFYYAQASAVPALLHARIGRRTAQTDPTARARTRSLA